MFDQPSGDGGGLRRCEERVVIERRFVIADD